MSLLYLTRSTSVAASVRPSRPTHRPKQTEPDPSKPRQQSMLFQTVPLNLYQPKEKRRSNLRPKTTAGCPRQLQRENKVPFVPMLHHKKKKEHTHTPACAMLDDFSYLNRLSTLLLSTLRDSESNRAGWNAPSAACSPKKKKKHPTSCRQMRSDQA